MPERIAEELLSHTYEQVAAVVSLGIAGEVIRVRLFHTVYGVEHMALAPDAREIWLLINHPLGNPELNAADRRVIATLEQRAGGVPTRVFVTGEDIGCREVSGLAGHGIMEKKPERRNEWIENL